MFVDHATIHIQSGAGGNGMVAWRREKYVPFGGPAGGDGGPGGSVYLQACSDLSTLLDFRYQSLFRAEDGEKGGIKNCHGKTGKDLIIRVPRGTIVRDADTQLAIADLTNDGDQVMVASGGRGGRGNARFSSSKRQSPQFSEPGEPSIERDLYLELKLLAEVGIIGLPNAGKSTLISAISAAKPKIANYPFTTLVPNLGVVRRPGGDGLVIADIPGLVEGASEGIGLGHDFLRHVERTRLLLHLVDAAEASEHFVNAADNPSSINLLAPFELINRELEQYNPRLAQKPQMVILSKCDAALPEALDALKEQLHQQGIDTVYTISAVSHTGLDTLLSALFEKLAELPPDTAVVEISPDLKAFDNDDSAYEINRKGKMFYVVGGKINRLFSVTDLRNREASQRLMNILKAMGIFKALQASGAKEGHIVRIAGIEFNYVPEDDRHSPLAYENETLTWELEPDLEELGAEFPEYQQILSEENDAEEGEPDSDSEDNESDGQGLVLDEATKEVGNCR